MLLEVFLVSNNHFPAALSRRILIWVSWFKHFWRNYFPLKRKQKEKSVLYSYNIPQAIFIKLLQKNEPWRILAVFNHSNFFGRFYGPLISVSNFSLTFLEMSQVKILNWIFIHFALFNQDIIVRCIKRVYHWFHSPFLKEIIHVYSK